MIAFESICTNKNGTFPSASAKNASSPSATDGTELIAGWVNFEWGWSQDLMSRAGLSPSGTGEVYGNAGSAQAGAGQQIRQALENCFGAPGELVFDVIPPNGSAYGAAGSVNWLPSWYASRRVLAANGGTFVVANYPELAAAIYCGDANNATADHCYRCSAANGTGRSTAGTYMVLPDYRGVTIRGRDMGNVTDPYGSTRPNSGTQGGVVRNSGTGAFGELASLQQDSLQGHYHYASSAGTTLGWAASNNAATGSNVIGLATSGVSTGSPITDTTNGTPRTGTESRMYNASCNVSVRY